MTTKIIIKNDESSNGDVVVQGKCTCEGDVAFALLPGEGRELWITTSSSFFITETWPTAKKIAVPE